MDVKEENYEKKYLLVESEKREKLIKVFIPEFSNYSFWQITYVDGSPIPELTSKFLTKRDALRALEHWEMNTKISRKKYQSDILGEKEPPVLKRKRVASSSNTEAG